MSLPINLVLIRHGQSQLNAARRLSEKGDHSAYTSRLRERHSSSVGLTDLGRIQAQQAGQWLRENNLVPFDRYFVSEYIRAMETAGHLAISGATWFTDFNLAERDWGELDICPEDEQRTRFGNALRQREAEPFFWRPPNGESFTELCLRVDRVLDTLHRECSDQNVLIVCHGEVMRAFQIRIERISQARFRELVFSERSEDKIHNCQIIHYSRQRELIHKPTRYVEYMRMIRPTSEPVWISGWQKIKRPRYSNEELLDIVSHTPDFIN